MKTTFTATLVSACLATSMVWSQATLRLPDSIAIENPGSVNDLQKAIAELNGSIGMYPPRVKSDSDRTRVYQQWSTTLQRALAVQIKVSESEDSLAAVADLYRQGHNLDVVGSGEAADVQLQKCLRLYPDSMACHRIAGYFYLAIGPKYAPKGEASLRRLKALFAPKVDVEVERGLVFAHVYQGKKAEAVKQMEYYLSLRPDDKWMRAMFDDLRSGGEITGLPTK